MIKTLMLDLGGVLVNWDYERFLKSLSAHTEKDKAEIDLSFNPVYDDYEIGTISSTEFYEVIKKANNLKLDEKGFFKLWNTGVTKIPGAVNLLNRLNGDYEKIIISNSNEKHVEYMESNFDFIKEFKERVYSNQVGHAKPSIEIYRNALARTKSLPAQCFFLDDLKENTDSASKLGIIAVRHTSLESTISVLEKLNIL